jgi:hypothetical protein
VRDLLFVGAVLLHRPDLDGTAALPRAVGDPTAVGRIGGAGVEGRVGREPAQVLAVGPSCVDVRVPVDVHPEGDPPVRRARVGGARRTAERGQSAERADRGDRCDGESPLHVIPPGSHGCPTYWSRLALVIVSGWPSRNS